MNLYDLLFRGKAKTQMPCSAFGCHRMVDVDLTKTLPELMICKSCEERFNYGIMASVHAHTGKLSGSYNIFDERLGIR